MFKKLSWAGLLLLVGAWSLRAADADETAAGLKDTTIKITEERKVIETRRVYETQTPAQPRTRKTAIFIENRAGARYNDKILFFEDQVASLAAGKDFTIISREDVVKSLKAYRGADVTVRNRATQVKGTGTASGQASANLTDDQKAAAAGSAAVFPAHAVAGGRLEGHATTERNVAGSGQASGRIDTSLDRTDVDTDVVTDAERNSLGTRMDQALNDNSTALRMAQNMGADFILFATIGSYGKEAKSFNDPSIGVKAQNTIYTLRGTFKVVEGVSGGALGGGTFRSAKTIRQSENLQTENDDLISELLEDAAGKVADGLAAKAAQFVPPTTPGKVEVTLACGVKDLAGNEISLPEIALTEDNKVVKNGQESTVKLSAMIEVDGISLGTTPASVMMFPGLHKLRLTRPGFTDFEGTINAQKGLSLSPTLQMNEQGYQRWKDIRAFLNSLDRNRKLTDAEVKVMEGYAQMLQQSGYKVDAKSDIKVDTKEGIKFNLYKSLY